MQCQKAWGHFEYSIESMYAFWQCIELFFIRMKKLIFQLWNGIKVCSIVFLIIFIFYFLIHYSMNYLYKNLKLLMICLCRISATSQKIKSKKGGQTFNFSHVFYARLKFLKINFFNYNVAIVFEELICQSYKVSDPDKIMISNSTGNKIGWSNVDIRSNINYTSATLLWLKKLLENLDVTPIFTF